MDCVDVGFLTDGTLDELPRPSRIGTVRVGGIDLNTPRIHHALTAVLALANAPNGFTVGQLATKGHAMTGHTDYTVRQAAYDLRKIRGKRLVDKDRADPAATTCRPTQPAPSPRCSPSATR